MSRGKVPANLILRWQEAMHCVHGGNLSSTTEEVIHHYTNVHVQLRLYLLVVTRSSWNPETQFREYGSNIAHPPPAFKWLGSKHLNCSGAINARFNVQAEQPHLSPIEENQTFMCTILRLGMRWSLRSLLITPIHATGRIAARVHRTLHYFVIKFHEAGNLGAFQLLWKSARPPTHDL